VPFREKIACKVVEIYTNNGRLKAGNVKVYIVLTDSARAIKKALPHAEERLFKQAVS